MNTSLSPHALQVKYVGQTIHYRTLSDLLKTFEKQQSVLVMPLERTITRDRLPVSQWIIHVTTRGNPTGPISFVSLQAAEVVYRAIGPSLLMPTQHDRLKDPIIRAHHYQEQLSLSVVRLLTEHAQVSQILPARYCLPEEWVWSSLVSEPRIPFRDDGWTLVEL